MCSWSSRRREVPTQGSWRLVDGENDSFDTRYLSSFDDDDVNTQLSGGASNGYPTQYSFSASQDQMSFDSQDSIRDFTNHQDDDQVILREPFRPTVPPSVVSGSTTTTTSRPSLYHNPDLQLRMPRVDVDWDLASSGRDSSRTTRDRRGTQSSNDDLGSMDESEVRYPSRGRRRSSLGRPKEGLNHSRNKDRKLDEASLAAMAGTRSSKSAPKSVCDRLPSPRRTLAHLGFIFGYVIAPILLSAAMYLLYSRGIFAKLLSQGPFSLPLALAPLSQTIKSVPWPLRDTELQGSATCNVDFRGLVHAQAKFADMLKKGRDGSSMPLELEGSEIATRNLRSLLKDSDMPSRDELVPELTRYIDKVGKASPDLQTFYIHISSTVDSVININRWTLRHASSLSVEPETPELPPLIAWAAWVLKPLRPSRRDINDRVLLEKYTEHIVLIQDRLERLTDEGSALALLLSHTRSHLGTIRELAKQSRASPPPAKHESFFSGIWSYLGSIIPEERRGLREQLDLLEKVDAQYSGVIAYVGGLVRDLKDMHAEFEDLLRRSAEPVVVWTDDDATDVESMTLSQQIDVVRNGLRQLENAKRRFAE